ncbi:helix-turn-helix domain-containing protein [Aliarcobacter butzleri]|uniref:helix-turn-helix domain-containing protein n=1 Tax=Aliarcobacter butzleri TaxID=28197 RepID=UPI003AF5A371
MIVITEKTKPGLINDIVKSIHDDTEKYIELCINMNEKNPIFSAYPNIFPSKINDLSKDDILKVIEDNKIIHNIAEIALDNLPFQDKETTISKQILMHLSDNRNIIKKTCTELGITQKELAEKLGASEGTVRNWSSSNDLPSWAINFINTLIEHKKDKDIATKFRELINLVK